MDEFEGIGSVAPIVHDWEWWSRFLQLEYYASPGERATWKRTVKGIVSDMNLVPGERLLDLGSGSGEFVIGMAEQGLDAVGVELYPSLVEASIKKGVVRGVFPRFVAADMFDWDPGETFDAIVSINTSFGYGAESDNRKLIESVYTWLAPDGRFYLDVLIADEAEAFGTWKDELAGGILEVENDWDLERSTMVSLPWWINQSDGTIHTADQAEEVRIYTIEEIEAMLRNAGFRFRRLPKGAGRRHRNESGVNSSATWLAFR
jgi:SAM-dependent methyltransferase